MASRRHVSRVTKTAMKRTADMEQIYGDTHPDLIPKTLRDRPVLKISRVQITIAVARLTTLANLSLQMLKVASGSRSSNAAPSVGIKRRCACTALIYVNISFLNRNSRVCISRPSPVLISRAPPTIPPPTTSVVVVSTPAWFSGCD